MRICANRVALFLRRPSEFAVREQLGHVRREVNPVPENANTVQTEFIFCDTLGDTPHALLGSLYLFAAAVGGGAVVASAGILGGAVAAALATAAVYSGVSGVLAMIAQENYAEYLHEQVDQGHLLLFVRARDESRQQQALEILTQHSAFDPRPITVKATRKG